MQHLDPYEAIDLRMSTNTFVVQQVFGTFTLRKCDYQTYLDNCQWSQPAINLQNSIDLCLATKGTPLPLKGLSDRLVFAPDNALWDQEYASPFAWRMEIAVAKELLRECIDVCFESSHDDLHPQDGSAAVIRMWYAAMGEGTRVLDF